MQAHDFRYSLTFQYHDSYAVRRCVRQAQERAFQSRFLAHIEKFSLEHERRPSGWFTNYLDVVPVGSVYPPCSEGLHRGLLRGKSRGEVLVRIGLGRAIVPLSDCE